MDSLSMEWHPDDVMIPVLCIVRLSWVRPRALINARHSKDVYIPIWDMLQPRYMKRYIKRYVHRVVACNASTHICTAMHVVCYVSPPLATQLTGRVSEAAQPTYGHASKSSVVRERTLLYVLTAFTWGMHAYRNGKRGWL